MVIDNDYGHKIIGETSFFERRRRRYMNEGLSAYGLHGTLFMYITTLYNFPGSSQDFLSEHLCIDKSNVARAAKKLETSGHIVREVSQMDRRQYCMYLTESGEKLYPIIIDLLARWSDIATKGIPEADKKCTAEVIHQMLENVTPKK